MRRDHAGGRRIEKDKRRFRLFETGHDQTGKLAAAGVDLLGAELMKGVVFNLLEEVVRRRHGEDTWDALLDQAGLAGSYTSLGSYPDEDMSKLVLAASRE